MTTPKSWHDANRKALDLPPDWGRPTCDHDWRISNYPEWQYYPFASFAGTYSCRRCTTTRYMTAKEEARYLKP